MIIAFTGPSRLSREQELAIAGRMDELASELDTWRSGCAYGVDTMAARHAVMSGVLGVELYVPAAPHNEELLNELDGIARIIRCGWTKDPYRRRNTAMVAGRLGGPKADLLVAFLKSPKFYRSGEWMTVNIATRAKVEVNVNLI